MTEQIPTRVVLEGLPRAGFYNGDGNPDDYCLPSVMRIRLEYLEDDCGIWDARRAAAEFLGTRGDGAGAAHPAASSAG